MTVRAGKFGKARLLPLQPSTVTAVNGYLRDRDRLCPVVASDALLVSVYGNRLRYNTSAMSLASATLWPACTG